MSKWSISLEFIKFFEHLESKGIVQSLIIWGNQRPQHLDDVVVVYFVNVLSQWKHVSVVQVWWLVVVQIAFFDEQVEQLAEWSEILPKSVLRELFLIDTAGQVVIEYGHIVVLILAHEDH